MRVLLCLSLSLSVFSLKDIYGVYPASRNRRLGLGSAPAPGRVCWRCSRPETASTTSAGRPVHQGADSLRLDRVGLSAPRVRPPCRDGLSIPSGPVPVQTPWVPLGPGRMSPRGLRISDDSARRGLHAAELAGLLAVEREPGCKLAVSVLDLPGPEAGPERRPLYGPIPWSWWLPASRLPGKSLQVGAVCWLLAGWERSAGFELALDGWADLGLSRFSASRGLDKLERAELVSVGRTPGRSPVVTIREVAG